MFCPGFLGVMVGCTTLIVWLLLKDRGTRRPDSVSLIALCVIMLSITVVFLAVFFIMMLSPSADWWPYHEHYGFDLRCPAAVAVLGYLVLLLRLAQTEAKPQNTESQPDQPGDLDAGGGDHA